VRPLPRPPPRRRCRWNSSSFTPERASPRGRDGRSRSVHVACHAATRIAEYFGSDARARRRTEPRARPLRKKYRETPLAREGGGWERDSLSSASAVLPVIIIQAHSSCGRSGHRCDVRAAGSAEGERP